MKACIDFQRRTTHYFYVNKKITTLILLKICKHYCTWDLWCQEFSIFLNIHEGIKYMFQMPTSEVAIHVRGHM